MQAHDETLHSFYRAFAALEPDGMARCHAPGVRFRDPVFDLTGRAHWEATYRFGATGRQVQAKANAGLRKYLAAQR